MELEQKAKLKDLFMAPIMGLLFAIFLPAIGLIMTLGILITKGATIIGDSACRVSTFGWRPSEAYLSGRKNKKDKKKNK